MSLAADHVKLKTLSILCEGETEFGFVQNVLTPHLLKSQVFAKAINLRGTPSLRNLKASVKNILTPGKSHEYVSMMIDLYKLGKPYGNQKVPGESVRDRVKRIELNLKGSIPNDNFIPYIQLHEFEALFFVDLDKIAVAFPDKQHPNAIQNLKNQVGTIEPELINDTPSGAPSKRVIAEIDAYAFLKGSAGPQIAGAIGLNQLRLTCPNFNAWVTKLESL